MSENYGKEKVHLNLARLKKEGKTFEIVIDSNLAMDLKEGKSVGIREVLRDEAVFSDAKKGMLISESQLQEAFDTTDILKAAEKIIRNGEIQLTSEHRKRLADEKKRKIINIIQTNAVDPKTQLPHPLTRIENAFEEAKVRIDQNKGADEQVKDIVKQLMPILPIKFEIKQIQVRIPPEYGAKAYPVVKGIGRLMKDEWLSDGSWLCEVEIPAGLETEFYDKLNSLTHGNIESKILNTRS